LRTTRTRPSARSRSSLSRAARACAQRHQRRLDRQPAHCTVRVFRPGISLEVAIEFHAFARLERCHACDQCHSSRVFTPLTGSHCKLRPNNAGPTTKPHRRKMLGLDLSGFGLASVRPSQPQYSSTRRTQRATLGTVHCFFPIFFHSRMLWDPTPAFSPFSSG
jgi:hypothetical protein